MELRNESGLLRAEARVTWEDAGREPIVLFFEVDARFKDAFGLDPNGFFASALLPAWHAGEKRVKIDGSLCPVLCSNLKCAIMLLGAWYPEMGTPPIMEPEHGLKAIPPSQARTGLFLSCGIDSMATLRWNKLNLPSDHPDSIQTVIPIDFIKAPFMTEQEARNINRTRAASAVAADAGIEVIPVTTNILSLDGDGWFFNRKWHGGVLGAVGYCLSKGLSKIYIASSAPASHTGSWGSHPLVDSWYSSAHLQIQHHGITNMSRLERTELVANWPVGLDNILVCQGEISGDTNCGACEKCIRTMMGLEAFGKLKESRSFPIDEVTPELLGTLEEYGMRYSVGYYRGLMPLLEKRGRSDLVAAIEQLSVTRAQKPQQPEIKEQDIAEVIPAGNAIILADESRAGRETVAGRTAFYWGSPSNDEIAMHEFETLRKAGGKFIVFKKPVLWWLDYYPDLHKHLRSEHRCILENDNLVIFDLRPQEKKQG